jgi:hypothetical protein
MKVTASPPGAEFALLHEDVARLTVRYNAAYAKYQDLVEIHAELSLDGGKLSEQALLDEEQAFEELDCARHALFDAAALAYPTIH